MVQNNHPSPEKAGRSAKDSNETSRDGAPRFKVIGIGASSGGLNACRALLKTLPKETGFAFIFVQHLDPVHDSMLAELLTGQTAMEVVQATDGMPVEPDHLYVIPPGFYLSIEKGRLRLSEPQVRHGARMTFDFLLHSIAREYGPRSVAVVLSGNGADGTAGIASIKQAGGLVIIQDPDEAEFDGMPRNAIASGTGHLVLPIREIAKAIMESRHATSRSLPVADPPPPAPSGNDRSAPGHHCAPQNLEQQRFFAVQAGNAATPCGAAHGHARHSQQRDRPISGAVAGKPAGAAVARQRSADQRDRVFPRRRGFQIP